MIALRTPMLCIGLTIILSINSGFRLRNLDYNTDNSVIIASENYSMPASSADSINTNSTKKLYRIVFDNKSEYPLEVAIRYKVYDGKWTTDAWVTIEPGEKKVMGSSDETTYFYYAQTDSKRGKYSWRGKHKFKTEDKSLSKLRFRKQEIWECYNTQMCNAFTVFK